MGPPSCCKPSPSAASRAARVMAARSLLASARLSNTAVDSTTAAAPAFWVKRREGADVTGLDSRMEEKRSGREEEGQAACYRLLAYSRAAT